MADTYSIKMPQLSDTMTEGVLVSWEKNPGDEVRRGDIVATVETDKAIMDVEVFRDGFLSGPLAPIDSTVPVGGPIAYIVADAASVSDRVEAPTAAAPADAEPVGTTADPGEAGATVDGGAEAPAGAVYTIMMPQLSDTMTEGVLVSWDRQPGDKITRGTVVAQVETDKAIMDVEVFKEGYLSGPVAPVDATIPVGGALAWLVAEQDQVVTGEASSVAVATPAGKAAQPVRTAAVSSAAPTASTDGAIPVSRVQGRNASPFARLMAGLRGVELAGVSGSGAGGFITAADVAAARPAAAAAGGGSTFSEAPVPGNGRAMSGLEKAISRVMSSSLSMPTFHVTTPIRLGALIKAAKAQGVSVTVAIARACALAMQRHPQMNWCYQPSDRLVERSSVDIGMAVAADDGGLVVPVLRGCETRELSELNDDWKDLVSRARRRRLKPEEYSGSTFQISNMGMFGVSQFDAIATPGIAAILAIAADTDEGSPFTITADHRVVNGADVAMFLKVLKKNIEQCEDWMGPTGKAIPEGDWDYEVVVIGGGPGGEDCARDLAAHGVRVALVNDSPFPGGECLWRGCIPSKAWRAAADRIRDRAEDAHLGVTGTTGAKLEWAALEKTRRGILETRGDMALKTDKGVRIEYIQGFARFADDHHIDIDSSGNQDDPHSRANPGDGAGARRVSFGCAVIATGAPPFIPPIPGAREGLDSGIVLTSDTVWALDKAPSRLVVIGGGAIGVEMAQIFQDFGAEVTLLEAQPRILAEVEPEVAKQLTAVLNADPRLSVHTGVSIDKISGKAGNVQVQYKDVEGKAHKLGADYVVMATGKRPVLDGLGLDRAGVELEGPVVRADARCRTSLPHVFGVGDVIGGLMLAHTAAQQGRVAAASILGEDMKYDETMDCGVIFTRPQAAFVGLSVEQAKVRNIEAVEVKVPMNIDAKAMINNEQHGLIKIVADRKSRRVVGVHLLADHADTLIGEAVMMVSGRMTLDQVGNAIHPHPTQTELFGDLARRLLSRLRRSAKAKSKA